MKNNKRRLCAAVLGILLSVQNTATAALAYDTDAATEKSAKPVQLIPSESVSGYGLKTLKYYDEAGNEFVPNLKTNKLFASVTDKYYNAYEEGRVTVPKNQGSYGVCWSFAGLSCAETSLIDQKAEGLDADFSERHLNWFTNGADCADKTDPLYGGCSNEGTGAYDAGGHHLDIISTMSRRSGPVYESVAPYSTKTALSESLRYQSEAHLTGSEWYDRTQVDLVKKAILEHGSVYCGYSMDERKYYNSETYSYYCPVENTDYGHAVTIVGWDDNYSRENFIKDPGEDGAWIVKNSWGADWGDEGFFYMSYKDMTIHALASFDMTPVEEDYENVYQYDAYAKGEGLWFEDKTLGVSAANVFTAESNEEIKAVSFMTMEADSDYIIRIYTDVEGDESPVNGELVYSQTGKAALAGYHTVDLTSSVIVEEGTDFSVVVIYTDPGSMVLYDGGSVETGRSFISAYDLSKSSYDSWYDGGVNWGVDFIVKAFTDPYVSDEELSITKHPSDVTAEVGSSATFAVEATGSALSYQWQYSKNGGARWINAPSTKKSYTIENLKAYYDGYMYRCVVSDINGNSMTSDAATLTIGTPEALEITSHPESITVQEGSPAVFSVTATGKDLTYQWQYSKDNGATWANTSTKTDTYTIGAVKSSYNGYKYRCTVTDGDGNIAVSLEATLNVESCVTITRQPEDVTAAIGSSAVFSVAATGTGLRYQWQYSKDSGATWANTSTRTASYTIGAVKSSYNGYMYRCKVTDAEGNSVVSDPAALIIDSAVTITGQPEDVTAAVGSSAVFSVTANGTGLKYQWQYSKDNGTTWSNTSARTAVYTIGSVKMNYDGYMYRCKVTGADGSSVVSNAAVLNVSGAVSLEITSQPEDVTAAPGAAAVFSVTANGTGLKYQWQYSKDGGTTWANTSTRTDVYAIGSVKESYNGYMYRCKVTDGYGKTVISNSALLTVAASPIVITSQPESVTVTAGSSVTFDITAEGNGLKYQWQSSKNGGETWSNVSCTSASYTLASVRSYYDGYMYRCVITDADGNTVTSNAAVLTVGTGSQLGFAEFTGFEYFAF